MLLAIDTATRFAGLALYNEDSLWAEEIWFADRNHTVELMPRLHRMLKKAQLSAANLSAIAVALGPGSYTGVRIGVAATKGLALPHNIPAVGLNTLDITAWPHQQQKLPVAALVRAGRKRFIMAIYQWTGHLWGQTQEAQLLTLPELAAQLTEPVLLAGEINAAEIDVLRQKSSANIEAVSPVHRLRRPGVLAELGAKKLAHSGPDTLSQLNPIYLKEP